jgi:hypothetical protein
MHVVINIKNQSKAKSLIDFLKQLDFIEIEEISRRKKILKFQYEILESFADINKGKVSSLNNKKISL